LADTGSTPESLASTDPSEQDGTGGMLGCQEAELGGHDRRRRSRLDPMSWDEGVVTVMVRQIPRQFTQLIFLKEVNRRGFEGLYDFLYLPFDLKKGINVGYGFLSFIDPKHAQDFRTELDGAFLDRHMRMKGKPLRIHPAKVQGYEANYKHFVQTKTGQKQDPHFSPLFFPSGGSRVTQSQAASNLSLEEEDKHTTRLVSLQDAGACSAQPQFDAGHTAVHNLAANQSLPSAGLPQWCQRTGQRPNTCQACGLTFRMEHNFCARCGTRVSNRAVNRRGPHVGAPLAEYSAKLFQDLEAERHRLSQELAAAQAKAPEAGPVSLVDPSHLLGAHMEGNLSL